jgi:hypothetical protein
LGIKYPRVIVKSLLGLYAVLMDTIERELLHRIITDRPFAEYITQRIDIGDFDDEVANSIYDGIVDLLCQERQISFAVLLEYFNGNELIAKELNNLAKEGTNP